jgi:hypothetical protein
LNLSLLRRWETICVFGFCWALAGCSGSERASPPPEGWQSLFDGESLSGWEAAKFGGEGWVRVKNRAIYLFQGDPLTGITWVKEFPRYDYEISLQAQRVQGNDFFCALTFPVGDSFCSLIVGGWGGAVVGISNVDGKDASENETSRLKRFEKGRWYQLRVCVLKDWIKAWIDEEKLVDLMLEGRRLDVRPEVRLSRPFGIAAWETTAALKDIWVRHPLSTGHEKSAINP